VRQINRIQGGVIPSFQPVQAPTPPVQPKPPRKFKLPQPDPNSYAATAYLRKRCIHPNVLSFLQAEGDILPDQHQKSPQLRVCRRDGKGKPRAAVCAAAVRSSFGAIFPAAPVSLN
jgi:hypothetical protein